MPIQITCTGCQAKLKAPDTAAGKKTKCPKCQSVISVPAVAEEGLATKRAAGAASLPAKTKGDHWFLQTPDGSQYGPVPQDEMDQWFAEGRVSADCQVLKQGGTQWQWAAELYPALVQLAGASVGDSGSFSAGTLTSSRSTGSAAALANPLTPLSSLSKFSDSPDLSPLSAGAPSSTATLPSFTTGTAPSYSSPLASPGLGSNPYATPLGSYQRSGPHPMVIVAGIFHMLCGACNVILCLFGLMTALMLLLAGGTAAAVGANMDQAEAQGMAGGLAAFGVIGSIVAFIFAIGFLAYGIFQFCTSVGLFRRRRWAKVASFVFAGLGIVFIATCLMMLVLHGGFLWALGFLAELVYVVVLLVAMCLPDATRDFS